MATSKTSGGGKGQQPEALKTFHAAAQSGSMKPKEQGLNAKTDTAPTPKAPRQKSEAAAEVLEAGAKGRPRTSKAAKNASDR